jgi:hypothetical protein
VFAVEFPGFRPASPTQQSAARHRVGATLT